MTDFDAINVILSNRSLLKRRKFKDTKNLVIKTSGKTELEFQKVTSKELEIIKVKIRKDAKKTAQLEILIYGGSALILFSILAYLSLRIIKG